MDLLAANTHLTRIEITGKRGRRVPFILTEAMRRAVDLLLRHREKAGVLPGNPFIFGIPGMDRSHLMASAVIRKITNSLQLDVSYMYKIY